MNQVDYMSLTIDALPVDQPSPFDLYRLTKTQPPRFILLCPGGTLLSRRNIEALKSQGLQHLFALPASARKHSGGQDLRGMREASQPSPLQAEQLSQKMADTYSLASQRITGILARPTPRDIKDACASVDQMIELILTDDAVLKQLISLTTHDYYTYTHSVNVCIYCLALGCQMGCRRLDHLRALGIGGLLHDIGKRSIASNVISKPGQLSEEEWEEIQRHPLYGASLLNIMRVVPPTSIAMVLQHQERYDGKGYPGELSGQSTHVFSRVCTIADAYDAMTTNRSYRRAMPKREALARMLAQQGKQFDGRLLKHFTDFLDPLLP